MSCPVIRTCQVLGCRYADTHTTYYHRCGGCKKRGHGQMECSCSDKISELEEFKNDILDQIEWCNVPGCSEPSTHNTDSHHCLKCDRRHKEENCIIQSYEYYRNKFQDNDVLSRFDYDTFLDERLHSSEGFILQLNIAMDHSLFIKCKNGLVNSLFMHGDSWGQYGTYEDLNIYREFSNGCIVSNTEMYLREPENLNFNVVNTIKCPICRTENNDDQIHTMYSSSEECKICLLNKVNKFFSGCGHACVCDTCLDTLRHTIN